jgi:hypothetical protein
MLVAAPNTRAATQARDASEFLPDIIEKLAK